MKSIQVKSFCKNTLNAYVSFLENILKKLNVSYKIVFLPTKEKKITLLTSPHVYKKAKEQFKFSSFKTVIFIEEKSTLNLFSTDLRYFIINKPKSIFIKVRI